MALAAGGVRYTLAQAFEPKTPKAKTSVPTSKNAAATRPAAPPGKLLIFSPGFGVENFQIKNAKRNCEARNEMPASSIVSAYCSSINWRCVEISCGSGHRCITMGTAEAIAMRIMITANIFAISSRLWLPSGRYLLFRSNCSDRLMRIAFILIAAAPAAAIKLIQLLGYLQCLLRLEGEIGASCAARRNRHFLSLSPRRFLPCRHRVASRRDTINRVSALAVGGRIGPLHHDKPAVHPGMDIALHRNHFRSLPALFDRRSPWWLRLIPWNIPSHRIRQRMNVVRSLIAGGHLEFLINIQRQNVRSIHAVLLIEDRLRPPRG